MDASLEELAAQFPELEKCSMIVKDNNFVPDLKVVTDLLSEYNGTLSPKDQYILFCISKLEQKSVKESGASLLHKISPLLWSERAKNKYVDLAQLGISLWSRPNSSDVLSAFNARNIWLSIDKMPMDISNGILFHSSMDYIYDPRFLLPNLVGLLASNCIVSRREFTESNALSYAFACLSLKSPQLRALAYTVLYRFRYHLKSVSEEEYNCKGQLLYLLNLFKNSIDKKNRRISNIMSLFLARTVQIVQHSTDSLYNIINGYLLLKPTLDMQNIPEFFKLFNSSSNQNHKREREWILKLIADGMKEMKDYRVLQRRFGIKILLSYFGSHVSYFDSNTQILSIIGRICNLRMACVDLCMNHAFIPWIICVLSRIDIQNELKMQLCVNLPLLCNNLSKFSMPIAAQTSLRICLNSALKIAKQNKSDELINNLNANLKKFV